ncbi:MAG: hypothetical protein D6771_01115, partial [Zetaproteobacteria bacterium]
GEEAAPQDWIAAAERAFSEVARALHAIACDEVKKYDISALVSILARGRYGDIKENPDKYTGQNQEIMLKTLMDEGWPAACRDFEIFRFAVNELLMTKDSALRKGGGLNRTAGFVFDKAGRKEAGEMLDALRAADVEVAPGVRARLEEVLSMAARAPWGYTDDEKRALSAMAALIRRAESELAHAFAERGEVDFVAIAEGALRALGSPEQGATDALMRLDARIRHVLVDEFQDTSIVQLEMFRRITHGFSAEEQRTLFMVGDPMQSIYGFRDAQVWIFDKVARNETGLWPVEEVRLSTNFRSAPAIVDWVNRLFARIQPPGWLAADEAVRPDEAQPMRTGEGRVGLHLGSGTDLEDEAHYLADTLIPKLLERHKRVAALAPKRDALAALARALKSRGIAFFAHDVVPLGETWQAQLVRALMTLIVAPWDRAAWAAVLRSRPVGLDAEALAALCAHADAEEPAWCVDAQMLDAAGRARVEHAKAACERMRARVASGVDAAEAIAEALAQLGAYRACAHPEDRENLDAALDLARATIAQDGLDLAAFDARIAQLYAYPDASEAAQRLVLSTIHGAKGLEWDAVILFGLGSESGNDQARFAWTDLAGRRIVAASGFRRGEAPALRFVRDVRAAREQNERMRLFYVGCTRARDELHLVASLGKSGNVKSGAMIALVGPTKEAIEDATGLEAAEIPKREDERLAPSAELVRAAEVSAQTYAARSWELAEPVFGWADPDAAAVGEAVHAALQRIAEEGVERWDANDARLKKLVARALAWAGVPEARLPQALARALTAVRRAMEGELGRWVLSGKHQDARCEWEIVHRHAAGVERLRIDRAFVDERGERWIIDYKTSAHEGGDLEAFLEQEARRYRAQLARYREAVAKLEPG